MFLRFVLIFLGIVTLLFSKAGDFDSSFGLDRSGKVTTNINNGDTSHDKAYDVAISSDGEIFVAGSTDYGPTVSFALVKYKQDGSLDESFDVDGKVTAGMAGVVDNVAYSVALQNDGKIIEAGYFGDDFGLVRYLSSGSIDNNFGTSGYASTDFGGAVDKIYDIVIQSDGKIVSVGTSTATKNQVALARYETNGTLDQTFGTNGKVLQNISNNDSGVYSVVLDKDQKIIVAGYSNWFGTDYFTLLKYKSDGTLDDTFGNHATLKGMTFTDFGASGAQAKGIAIQNDGKIVVAGYSDNSSNLDMALARYETNGTLDQAFGANGKVIYAFSCCDTSEEINDIVIGRNGKILVAGSFMYNKYAMLACFNSKGDIDTTFANDGRNTFSWDEDRGNIANGLVLEKSGKIVMVGFHDDFSVARFLLEMPFVPIYYLLLW